MQVHPIVIFSLHPCLLVPVFAKRGGPPAAKPVRTERGPPAPADAPIGDILSCDCYCGALGVESTVADDKII